MLPSVKVPTAEGFPARSNTPLAGVQTKAALPVAVAGTGFRATPLVDLTGGPSVPTALAGWGPVVAKVETANVSGSHKARHLFGLLLRLLVDEAAAEGGAAAARDARPLAIASCGNAALGAAVVAALLAGQFALMARFLKSPRERAAWYNGTGTTLYVLGMLVAAFALRPLVGGA